MSVLVTYASKHGSTREVAEAVADRLAAAGLAVDVCEAADVDEIGAYAGVVLGGSLYMGRWHADAIRFLRRFEDDLAGRSLAVFALGPKTLAASDVAGSRAQLDAALARVPAVRPDRIAIFGGVIDPSRLRFPLNRIPASDARDWDAIAAWAGRLTALFSRQLASV